MVAMALASPGWSTAQEAGPQLQGCVGEQVCRTAKQMASQVGPGPYTLIVLPESESGPTFIVAQYQIKSIELLDEKVAQFPKGTRFVLPDISDPHLEDKIRDIFAKHAMIFVDPHAGLGG